MQIICQQLAPAQSFYAVRAALGIAEGILPQASPAGLVQNVLANIVRSAPPPSYALAVVHRGFDQPRFVSISLFNSPIVPFGYDPAFTSI
jgi:hypothetical protein